MNITAVVLTFNESLHLDRCLSSVSKITKNIIVVDCYSTDETVSIAAKYSAKVLKNKWVNHATQFNWAINRLDDSSEWIFRIDADEYLTTSLISSINSLRDVDLESIEGISFGRRMAFQGRLMRYGGVFPVKVLRIFRAGKGHCENRWMDEHIKVNGNTLFIDGELIDDNLNTLTWWIDKHNKYASREVVDLLNLKYGFIPRDTVARMSPSDQAAFKRWLKEVVYAKLPVGFRAFLYFSYRYFLRFGFLDGIQGTAFHVLQGFWYRYLVDLKLIEVQRFIEDNKCEPKVAIKSVLGIDLL